MKYLIAGLGNPGAEYASTRHNIGFMAVDQVAAKFNKPFEQDRHGYSCTVKHRGRTLRLLKPTTYMNLSGKAVRYHLQDLKIKPDRLLVVTDDISLPFNKIRIRPKGSSAGHNGLQNIEDLLNSSQYPRLKCGVGNDFPKGAQADYVLSPFPNGEMQTLDETLLPKIAEAILAFTVLDIGKLMSQYNR